MQFLFFLTFGVLYVAGLVIEAGKMTLGYYRKKQLLAEEERRMAEQEAGHRESREVNGFDKAMEL